LSAEAATTIFSVEAGATGTVARRAKSVVPSAATTAMPVPSTSTSSLRIELMLRCSAARSSAVHGGKGEAVTRGVGRLGGATFGAATEAEA
jgi:hypothetical protein